MTVLVAGVFAALAAGVAALQGQRVGLVAAAVIAALVFGPALRRSQHLVDELFYGHRTDPYRALSDLSQRLDAVASPGAVLNTVVTAVAESLRLPYVAIERPGDGSVLAQHGDRQLADEVLGRWRLVSQGTHVGTLVAAPRRGESELDARDRAVLADLARQAGAAVHAEALTADLVASRQRLVEAREEERRRLRRDLHDGLGPLLTSVGLNLDAVRAQLTAGSGDPLELVARAKEASSQAIADLRTVVYSLRPPALDDLGVVGAITAQVRRMARGQHRGHRGRGRRPAGAAGRGRGRVVPDRGRGRDQRGPARRGALVPGSGSAAWTAAPSWRSWTTERPTGRGRPALAPSPCGSG